MYATFQLIKATFLALIKPTGRWFDDMVMLNNAYKTKGKLALF